MRSVLGSRASIGGVLGSGRGAAATADWWLSGGVSAANAIAVYQPIGAASLAASYTNLANPGTYTAAPGVAPTFAAATGWTFATNKWLNSGVPGTSALSMLIRFSNATGNLITFGAAVETGSTKYILWRPRTSTNRQIYLQVSSITKAGALSGGVYGYVGATTYLDGSNDGSVLPVPSLPAGLPGIAIYFGALNFAGAATQFGALDVQAVAIYNTTLSAAQVAAISSAMTALTG